MSKAIYGMLTIKKLFLEFADDGDIEAIMAKMKDRTGVEKSVPSGSPVDNYNRDRDWET